MTRGRPSRLPQWQWAMTSSLDSTFVILRHGAGPDSSATRLMMVCCIYVVARGLPRVCPSVAVCVRATACRAWCNMATLCVCARGARAVRCG